MSVIIKLLSKFDDSGLRKAKSGFSGLTKSLGAVGIGIGLKQITDGLMEVVTLASNAAEQTAAVGQIFGQAGATAIQNFAATANTSLGQTSTQVLEAAKSFGIFGKAAGLASKDNADFTTTLITLSTDLASFNNTSVVDAATALSAGLRGESEPLRRYGILITDKIVKDKGMALGLGVMTKTARGFTYTMTEQEKILARNAVILEQTATQQGDFARTSGGLANQQRILTASFEEAKTTLGEALLPTFTKFVTYLNSNVIPSLQTFFEDVSNPKTDIGQAFATFGDTVKIAGENLKAFFGLMDPKGEGDAMSGFASSLEWISITLQSVIDGLLVFAGAWDQVTKGNFGEANALMSARTDIGAMAIRNRLTVADQIALINRTTKEKGSGMFITDSQGGLAGTQDKVFFGGSKTKLPTAPRVFKPGATNTNVTINVLNADPKATVDALGKYIKSNGSLPFNFTNGKAGR